METSTIEAEPILEAVVADERTPLLRDVAPILDGPRKPWWKRASVGWLVPGVILMSISMGSTASPKVEIYNMLACRALLGTAVEAPTVDHSASGQPWLLLGTDLDMDICRHNPMVQRAVTQLVLILTLLMGVLSAITAGFWGSYSDRKGRKLVLALTQLGFLLADVVFLVVVIYSPQVHYQLLFLGPSIDGLFGGFATAQACFGAYISDCTPRGSRASVFGLLMALIFAGFAIGPSLGAFLVSWTDSVLSPFWFAAGFHAAHFIGIIIFLPESRSPGALTLAEQQHEQQLKVASHGHVSAWSKLKSGTTAALIPLLVFWPRELESIAEEQRSILRPTGHRSHALALVGVAYAFSTMSISIYAVKMQYAQYRFGWGPQENGYLLTLAGIARCLVLLILLPLVSRMLRSQRHRTLNKQTRDGLAVDPDFTPEQPSIVRAKLLHDSHMDLVLGRASIAFDLVGYSVILVSRTPAGFICGSALAALGAGAGPAIQSLALMLSSPGESGKLLAALSVLQSLSGQIVGPLLFNAVFAMTIEWHPAAVFASALAVFGASFICLICIRLARRSDLPS